ncbi:hypothetical protein ACB098_11G011700 [Castanea mollissima]
MAFLTFYFILSQHIVSQPFWTRFKQSACCSIQGWLVMGKSLTQTNPTPILPQNLPYKFTTSSLVKNTQHIIPM